jgi:hypothetical protein
VRLQKSLFSGLLLKQLDGRALGGVRLYSSYGRPGRCSNPDLGHTLGGIRTVRFGYQCYRK